MNVHTFDPRVAKEHGVVEAVVIKSFQFWIAHNHENGTHRYDGRTWTYNSTRAMRRLFPYLSEKQIYGVLKRLIDRGVLVTGNYNKTGFDRTTWYAFAEEGRWISPPEDIHFPAREDGSAQTGGPIPDQEPVTNTSQEPSPAQARAGAVFIVAADGTVVAPEKPEIPAAPPPVRPPERPESGRNPRNNRNSPPDRDWQRWVDRYEEHVKGRNDGIGHHWTKVQLGPQGLKGIRAHLVKVSVKAPDRSDDDCGFAAWCYVLEHWAQLDEWLRGQFDLCVLLKKITDILNRLKNGAHTNGGAAAPGGGKAGTSAARNQALADY